MRALERLDKLLVQRKLAATRTQAQKLIEAGCVEFEQAGRWQQASKPSLKIESDAPLRVGEHPDMRFASRAGLKLEAALKAGNINVRGLQCLDVGQSTGGFTDCLLQAGAAHVFGVEVGHDQLLPALRADSRVTCLEGVNARYLSVEDFPIATPLFEVVVMDVSFISQRLILPQLPALMAEGARLITLIKPQFEVGPKAIGKGGLVSDQKAVAKVLELIKEEAGALGLERELAIDSPTKGGDGIHEYLWLLKKA